MGGIWPRRGPVRTAACTTLAGAEIDRRISNQRSGTIGTSRSMYLRTLEDRLKTDPEVMAHLTASAGPPSGPPAR